jgi:GLPGLI family protein
MKKIILLCCLFAVSFAYAQKKEVDTNGVIDKLQFVVYYHYQIHSKDKVGKAVCDTCDLVLEVGKKISKFDKKNIFLADSITENKPNITQEEKEQLLEQSMQAESYNMPVVYQNYPSGKMTIRDSQSPHYYVYQEKIRQLKWNLSDESTSICGYDCKKATTTYGGRTWTVWYTEDIPTTFGPWKLNGLPGLILQAEDADHQLSFTMYGLVKSNIPIKYKVRASDIKTTRDKFISFKNSIITNPKYVTNPLYYIAPESLKAVTVFKRGGVIVINDGSPISMIGHVAVPLELK